MTEVEQDEAGSRRTNRSDLRLVIDFQPPLVTQASLEKHGAAVESLASSRSAAFGKRREGASDCDADRANGIPSSPNIGSVQFPV